MKGYFVTGTDTGVGKTLITGSIARALSAMGKKVGVMKPLESGCASKNGRLIPEDALFLKKMSGCSETLEKICIYRFSEPLAPGVAAKMGDVSIEINKIKSTFLQIAAYYDILFVEGAGGLMVPIGGNKLMVDLIRLLHIPALIIARTALGTINHTLLTVKQAQDYGIKITGIIYNELSSHTGKAEKTNPGVIKEFSEVPLLGVFPLIPEKKRDNPEFLAALAKVHIDLSVFDR